MSTRPKYVELLPQFGDRNAIPVNSLRWWYQKRASNGSDTYRVFYKIGARVMIDPEAFWVWQESRQSRGA